MKKTRNKILTFAIITLTVISFIGCSNDDDESQPEIRKVVFKALTSEGANLNQAVYGYDTDLTTASGLSGSTWSSPEIEVPADASVVSVVVNAAGTGSTSTLKVQIYVDGVLQKESTSTGTALVAQAELYFGQAL